MRREILRSKTLGDIEREVSKEDERQTMMLNYIILVVCLGVSIYIFIRRSGISVRYSTSGKISSKGTVIVPPDVLSDTVDCPVPWRINKGKGIPKSGGFDDLLISENANTIEECAAQAQKITRDNNLLVKEPEDPGWGIPTKFLWQRGREERELLFGTAGVTNDIDFFYYNYGGPGKCQIYYRCNGTNNTVDGWVTAYSGDVEFNGATSLCVYKRSSDECLTSTVRGLKPTECTGLASGGGIGTTCRQWYNSLEKDVGAINRTNTVEEICSRFPDLYECDCLSRETREVYQKINKALFGPVSDVCWYTPCKASGNDRLVTPGMKTARDNCQVNFCGNFIQSIDSTDLEFLNEVKQYVNCTQSEWDQVGDPNA